MDLREPLSKKMQARNFGQIQRKYQRKDVPGVQVTIADDNTLIKGPAGDISTGGFKLIYHQHSFTGEKHTYTAILSDGGNSYKMIVTPCWQEKTAEQAANIGFKIIDAPWEWVEFTMKNIDNTSEN